MSKDILWSTPESLFVSYTQVMPREILLLKRGFAKFQNLSKRVDQQLCKTFLLHMSCHFLPSQLVQCQQTPIPLLLARITTDPVGKNGCVFFSDFVCNQVKEISCLSKRSIESLYVSVCQQLHIMPSYSDSASEFVRISRPLMWFLRLCVCVSFDDLTI